LSRLDALGAVIEKTKPLMENFIPEALVPSINGGTWWEADITPFPPKRVFLWTFPRPTFSYISGKVQWRHSNCQRKKSWAKTCGGHDRLL